MGIIKIVMTTLLKTFKSLLLTLGQQLPYVDCFSHPNIFYDALFRVLLFVCLFWRGGGVVREKSVYLGDNSL